MPLLEHVGALAEDDAAVAVGAQELQQAVRGLESATD